MLRRPHRSVKLSGKDLHQLPYQEDPHPTIHHLLRRHRPAAMLLHQPLNSTHNRPRHRLRYHLLLKPLADHPHHLTHTLHSSLPRHRKGHIHQRSPLTSHNNSNSRSHHRRSRILLSRPKDHLKDHHRDRLKLPGQVPDSRSRQNRLHRLRPSILPAIDHIYRQALSKW